MLTSFLFFFLFSAFQRIGEEPIAHRVTGPCHHSLISIQNLKVIRVIFSSLTLIYSFTFLSDLIKRNYSVLFFPFNQEIEEPKTFSTFRERLHHLQAKFYSIRFNTYYFMNTLSLYLCVHSLLQKTEKDRVCFGRSGIHGWGLFARRNIVEGEMVCPSKHNTSWNTCSSFHSCLTVFWGWKTHLKRLLSINFLKDL